MEIFDEEKMPLRHDSNPEVSINSEIISQKKSPDKINFGKNFYMWFRTKIVLKPGP